MDCEIFNHNDSQPHPAAIEKRDRENSIEIPTIFVPASSFTSPLFWPLSELFEKPKDRIYTFAEYQQIRTSVLGWCLELIDGNNSADREIREVNNKIKECRY